MHRIADVPAAADAPAKDDDGPPRVETREPSRGRLLVGTALIVSLVGLVVAMFVVTDGAFHGAYWPAFYVAVALISGLAFWLFTGSGGKFELKSVGRLGGGAAVGAIFMYLAHLFTPGAPTVVIDLPQEIRGVRPLIPVNTSPGLVMQILDGSNRVLLDFREGVNRGEIRFRHFDDAFQPVETCYEVNRRAELSTCPQEAS